MKLTLSWLKEHLDTTADLKTITDTMTKIGLEVEDVYNPVENLKGFVTARAENVEKHPDSDHLHLLRVNTGTECERGYDRYFCTSRCNNSML